MTRAGQTGGASRRQAGLALLAGGLLSMPALALEPRDSRQGRPAALAEPSLGAPWGRINVRPGAPVDARPAPPKEGRKRCIGVDDVAGAQLFGDSGIELTMQDGRQYRMFFARECQALSFYQGFYYRRLKAGQLCAGRDVIGARSGGECQIASIVPVGRKKRKR